jgi:hypothetical protein
MCHYRALLSVTLDEITLSAQTYFAECKTLGIDKLSAKEAFCRVPFITLGKGTGKEVHWSIICREFVHQAIGKEARFAECLPDLSTKGLAKGDHWSLLC